MVEMNAEMIGGRTGGSAVLGNGKNLNQQKFFSRKASGTSGNAVHSQLHSHKHSTLQGGGGSNQPNSA